jgi:hypothetical protein
MASKKPGAKAKALPESANLLTQVIESGLKGLHNEYVHQEAAKLGLTTEQSRPEHKSMKGKEKKQDKKKKAKKAKKQSRRRV